MTSVIGWDVGGAHLKAARVENGRVVDAAQVASPLRFGLERLAQSFAEAKARIGTADRHAVTMTGELADLFASRGEGVELRAGMFFTIEPMVNLGKHQVKLLSDGWTAVTRDKSLSAQCEHSIGVTETGVEVFTASPAGLFRPIVAA